MRISKETLWALTRGQRGRYAMAIVALAVTNLFLFAVPLISRLAIDGLLTENSSKQGLESLIAECGRDYGVLPILGVLGLLIITMTAFGGLFQYYRGRWAASAAENIIRRLRETLYKRLERLPCAFHDRSDTGDLVQRCSSDVETVRVFLASQVIEIGRAILMVLTVLPILLWLNPFMTMISLCLLPLIVIFAVFFFRRVKVLYRLADEAEGAMTTVLQENLTGIRVVRAFARQDHECQKFSDKNSLFRDRSQRLMELLSVYWAVSDLLCFAQIGSVLMFGASLVSRGEMSVGTLMAFTSYEAMLIWPVRHLGRVLADTGKATVALERLSEVLLEEPETFAQEIPDKAAEGRLEVRGLGFSYDGVSKVLDDVSFDLEAGETLAILGATGAGKSTLTSLLARLYDYQEGSILLDGRELSSLDRDWVRSQMAVVLQESFLFSRSITENLRFGCPAADTRELERAAEDASIHHGIQSFDKGYETVVGERGVTLSGGQRQRLAIARALLEEAPVLILDDSLSAVDTKTEAMVLKALAKRGATKTTIMIAHRMSTVRHADRVLILDKGRVVQFGPHEELLKQEGPFRRLWDVQGPVEEVSSLQSVA